MRDALRDPELKGKLLNLLGSLNGVLSIDIVSAENKEVLASTLENRVGSKTYVPDFRALVNQSSWFEKLNVLLVKDRPVLHAAGSGGLQRVGDPHILGAGGDLSGADSSVANGHAV